MKKKINIKTGINILLLALGMLVSPLYSQSTFQEGGRQPFEAPASGQSFSRSNAPGSSLPSGGEDTKVGAGANDIPCPTCPGGMLPPPGEDDKVGAGAPVSDVFWLLPWLAVGYGVFKRKLRTKNFTPKSPKGDFSF